MPKKKIEPTPELLPQTPEERTAALDELQEAVLKQADLFIAKANGDLNDAATTMAAWRAYQMKTTISEALITSLLAVRLREATRGHLEGGLE